MREFLSITKALGDETRVRALLSLRDGELCLCQIIDVLGLSPSTVSKHMDLLYQAGLVQSRKEGRWHYFRLPGRDAPAMVRRAVQWVLDSLENEPALAGDSQKVCGVRRKDLKELCECYRA
jgi:DNA-binding transcriptional ArsR family regulator